jgi:cytochrome c biogenesis protein
MKLLKIKKVLNIFIDLKFALFLLTLISILSSIGSFIEQDESIEFYNEKYPKIKPIYGFIHSNLILNLGLDHIYRTHWFLSLLILFGFCLLTCTITRQFPLLLNSKKFFFKRRKKAFNTLPFYIKLSNTYYAAEKILLKIQKGHLYLYQNKKLIYGYKGLIGRMSPILVHFSLILILLGSAIGAFNNFKAQEMLPKGEFFHIQNPMQVGRFTKVPTLNYRINDFWVEYKAKSIAQFYSNISILDNFGNEIKQQTISVNNPLRYKGIDLYQSDWDSIGIRLKHKCENKIKEIPFFALENEIKAWVTWVKYGEEIYTLIFDQLQNVFYIYNQSGDFLGTNNIGDLILNLFLILETIPSTGLLLKYDPSISEIYLGFGLLILTTSLSFLPYTQIWLSRYKNYNLFGSNTNRGKIEVEIEFETLIRNIEDSK